ncbi:MAG: transglycosylase SLT domain-containing protein, partial [Acidimicrobiales bacterium]
PAPTPTPTPRPMAPNGRSAPQVPTDAIELAQQLTEAESGLRDENTPAGQQAELGHLQQVLYRKLAREPTWDAAVLPLVPEAYRRVVELQVEGRRALTGLGTGFATADFVPAWEVIQPEPAASLLDHYREAEDATGIEWEYLAAINLLETGFGRIAGLSGAGAQGPMQFLPSTWEEVGVGSITDPHDAILGAARYLVRRGGPADMDSAVLGYNNSHEYLGSVSAYAELLRVDPAAFTGLYNWEIYFFTDAGDVWLPVGYRSEVSIDVDTYLAEAPWSTPDLAMLSSEG